MTPFSGQTLNAGHFLQPATIAIGQRVMAGLFGVFDRLQSIG